MRRYTQQVHVISMSVIGHNKLCMPLPISQTSNPEKFNSTDIFDFTYKGYLIHILDIESIENVLKVDLEVSQNGENVDIDAPFYFINPYTEIPSGDYTPYINDDGGEELIPVMVEDYAGAIKKMVSDTLDVKIKQWQR